ncbi:heat shock 70 kDa protein 12B-like [Mercenaria mercenaria]|uniref:heat shock 70 kDa protein 12B-like n=1 Tax=Mercenaria mercenaria TaxID=6596 RepID=UPI00234EA7C2|nr:heat shock 70 kDa protein 12B-like [Mercenaria mercenaria]XP_045181828.2 heat shock 70 kDa protein 12B-like [Mercenaria mercenaria]XP_045181829.2 heat shock 70 kDa protein 12B-like [Mercenaria mercenaria]
MASAFKPHMVVAAFDFGTTYSGYAFSYRDEPTLVQTNQGWDDGSGSLISMKTPTCVLLTPDKEFDSFGYDAENKYYSLAGENKHQGWLLFRRFKMLLHNNENISRKTMVYDINGVGMPAVTIFTMAIRYLKDHLFKSADLFSSGFVTERDVKYVLTVPAIWTDSSKMFMREAAVEAGLADSRLKLCPEPEAASIYWQTVSSVFARGDQPQAGTSYMVVDLGGGTADIYVHEKLSDQTIKELYKASGGPWGGTVVDNNYLGWLTQIVGETAMERFKTEKMVDYFDLLRDFEVKKRTVTSETEGKIAFKFYVSLKNLYEELESGNLVDKLSSSGLADMVSLNDKEICIDASIVKSWFNEPVTNMIDHVTKILSRPDMQRVENVLLVGGFGESKIVQDEMRRRIVGKELIIPTEPSLSVLKGAVRLGQLPSLVSARVIKVRSERGSV